MVDEIPTSKMFAKSWKLMSDQGWAAFPTKTNAIESHNKITVILKLVN